MTLIPNTLGGSVNNAPVVTQVQSDFGLQGVEPTNYGPVAGGQTVWVYGAFLTGATSVTFGGLEASNIVVDGGGTFLTCEVPPAAEPGVVDVTVTTPAGAGTLVGGFEYVDPPSIDSIDPATLTFDTDVSPLDAGGGGGYIYIYGSNFKPGCVVEIDSTVNVPAEFISSVELRIVAPNYTVGVRTLVVANPDGQEDVTNLTYEAVPNPTITSIVPDNGPQAGGTQIAVNGTGFVAGSRVNIGGVTALSRLQSATQITCITPPSGGPGAVDVRVTNPNGEFVDEVGGFTYT